MHKDSSHAVFRILDASANRVGEGLRTVEEWARFALDNETLSAELKAIRHQVSTALAILPATWEPRSRRTPNEFVIAQVMSWRQVCRGRGSRCV